MDRTQVLVVEDEAVVAMDIQSKLEDMGSSVMAPTHQMSTTF